jgi:tRNA U34 5-carboxymethylaminomethyl modifying GTPase MnmE/TrmE
VSEGNLQPELVLIGAPLAGKLTLLGALAVKHADGQIRIKKLHLQPSGIWSASILHLRWVDLGFAALSCASGGVPPAGVIAIANRATAIVHCVDATRGTEDFNRDFFNEYRNVILPKRRFVLATKTDGDRIERSRIASLVEAEDLELHEVSALSGEGLDDLYSHLRRVASNSLRDH